MKIILIIFLCLNICTEISSECNGSDKNLKDCSGSNGKGKYPDLCCLFKKYKKDEGKFEEKGECKTIPYSSYYEGYSKEYIGEDLYSVECDTTDTKINTFTLEKCGNIYNKNPSKKDCKKYSSYVDSCCYYSGENKKDDPLIEGANFEKGCYWLGSKYEGSIFWAGARLECSYKFLKYSLLALLYLIISL